VPEVVEPLDRSLPSNVQHRLEQFLQRLDRLRVEDSPMFAAVPLDREGYDESVRSARRAAFDTNRRGVLDQVHRDADAWLNRLFSRHQFHPEWTGPQMGVIAGTVGDRIRLGEALKSVLTALVLWDVLDDACRDHLVGPWAALIEAEPS
jgi:hypothetical protein